MYFSRPKKGHEGIKGTVTEEYQGILVHDHESTFYKYGSNHQECLAHYPATMIIREESPDMACIMEILLFFSNNPYSF